MNGGGSQEHAAEDFMRRMICIVGAGPAGLRAAEVAMERGRDVHLFDAKPSPGRKFLVAGRGGLNLTNSDPAMGTKYAGGESFWPGLLADFGPTQLQAWVEALGVELFTASSGRVYPRGLKSAPLLRRWILKLKAGGVNFHCRHRWLGITKRDGTWELAFETPEGRKSVVARATIFAMGGGSWPSTGSDGSWVSAFTPHGLRTRPLVPANCGWEVAWSAEFLAKASGKPLKNIRATVGEASCYGELLITDNGFEGGVVYALTPALRRNPLLLLDLKPAFTREQLIERMPSAGKFHLHEAISRCRIKDAAALLMLAHPNVGLWKNAEAFADAVKALPIPVTGPRPLAEAISSAGGVEWDEVDETLMSRRMPGVFFAGEMLDWEAPTGGYLIQGCLATGHRAGISASEFCQ